MSVCNPATSVRGIPTRLCTCVRPTGDPPRVSWMPYPLHCSPQHSVRTGDDKYLRSVFVHKVRCVAELADGGIIYARWHPNSQIVDEIALYYRNPRLGVIDRPLLANRSLGLVINEIEGLYVSNNSLVLLCHSNAFNIRAFHYLNKRHNFRISDEAEGYGLFQRGVLLFRLDELLASSENATAPVQFTVAAASTKAGLIYGMAAHNGLLAITRETPREGDTRLTLLQTRNDTVRFIAEMRIPVTQPQHVALSDNGQRIAILSRHNELLCLRWKDVVSKYYHLKTRRAQALGLSTCQPALSEGSEEDFEFHADSDVDIDVDIQIDPDYRQQSTDHHMKEEDLNGEPIEDPASKFSPNQSSVKNIRPGVPLQHMFAEALSEQIRSSKNQPEQQQEGQDNAIPSPSESNNFRSSERTRNNPTSHSRLRAVDHAVHVSDGVPLYLSRLAKPSSHFKNDFAYALIDTELRTCLARHTSSRNNSSSDNTYNSPDARSSGLTNAIKKVDLAMESEADEATSSAASSVLSEPPSRPLSETVSSAKAKAENEANSEMTAEVVNKCDSESNVSSKVSDCEQCCKTPISREGVNEATEKTCILEETAEQPAKEPVKELAEDPSDNDDENISVNSPEATSVAEESDWDVVTDQASDEVEQTGAAAADTDPALEADEAYDKRCPHSDADPVVWHFVNSRSGFVRSHVFQDVDFTASLKIDPTYILDPPKCCEYYDDLRDDPLIPTARDDEVVKIKCDASCIDLDASGLLAAVGYKTGWVEIFNSNAYGVPVASEKVFDTSCVDLAFLSQRGTLVVAGNRAGQLRELVWRTKHLAKLVIKVNRAVSHASRTRIGSMLAKKPAFRLERQQRAFERERDRTDPRWRPKKPYNRDNFVFKRSHYNTPRWFDKSNLEKDARHEMYFRERLDEVMRCQNYDAINRDCYRPLEWDPTNKDKDKTANIDNPGLSDAAAWDSIIRSVKF